MKPKLYYHLKENIKNRIKYLERMENYFTYRELYIQSKYKLLIRKPFISMLLLVINLPINIFNYFVFIKDRYNYENAKVEIEIMAMYLWEIDQKEKETNQEMWRNKDFLSIIDKNRNKRKDYDQYH